MSQAPSGNQILGQGFVLGSPRLGGKQRIESLNEGRRQEIMAERLRQSPLTPPPPLRKDNQSQKGGLLAQDSYPSLNINQNLGRRLLLEENHQGLEVNIQNGSKLTMERNGDSVIIHIARNKDQSFFSWLAEAVGAAAYGVYSYGRDATIGVAWALSYLYPKDWESSREAAEVAGMVKETFSLLWNNLDKALMLLLIRMQMDTRGKMFIQMAARIGTGIAVAKIGTVHPIATGAAVGITAAAWAGLIYRVTNDVRILKKKGENIENIGDVILAGILTGDTDLKSTRQVMGDELYNKINYLIDNDKIEIDLGDTELKFINFIREEIGKIVRNDISSYLQNVLDTVN